MQLRRQKPKKKSNFIRRMTTFKRGSPDTPSQGRNAILNLIITAGLAVNLKYFTDVNLTLDGPSKTSHECLKRHVKHVYDMARGRDRLLSHDKLVIFLKATQGVEHVGPLKLEHYKFQEFFWLWCNHESAWRAEGRKQVEELDVTRPISNYFISSSHNTYLEGNQWSSDSSADAYRAVLRNGCRCIEIDVWNGPAPRSPSKSPSVGQRRHFSSGSLPRVAGETLDAIMSVRASRQHSRSPSAAQTASLAPDPRESGTTLDPKDLSERLQKSRDSSRSNHQVEPVVHHHGTWTSTVGFREVCRAIRESAFENNPLPIIISLEVGAEREQQEVMVDIMKEEWGELLLDKPLESCDPDQRQPRLEELYNKILIKVKRLSDCRLVNEIERGRSIGIPTIRSKPPICKALASLAIYTHSEHYEDETSLALRTPSHVFSLSEDSFRSLAEDSTKVHKLLAHNREYFMRIYPQGWRVDSSNPDPTFPWRRGAQMVAMNWQKPDDGMMLNDAMFAGTNGWVLKPPDLRSDSSASDLSNVLNVRKRTLDLRITVLAGQCLPLPEDRRRRRGGGGFGFGFAGDAKLRPRVKVELHVDKPHKPSEYARETAPAFTDNPDWGLYPPSLDFLDVKDVVEELSFVKFKVEDTSSNRRGGLVAWACIRLDRLQLGYRCVDLMHPATRQPCNAQLFVKVEKILRE
ncbi:a3b6c7d4-2dcf-4eb2-8a69-11b76417613d [Thermothielavioides terrestris]|uniref:Phosphoinositide phospholipase C n=1 Tax=Thermothielavioides terrestris TaxID=2587410 RepID=A0A446BAS6_9PEZI|nr:a3b6c7d4-2dcf-4eb2-8a69-11b76417613d [Thermothielavioides terrestris]